MPEQGYCPGTRTWVAVSWPQQCFRAALTSTGRPPHASRLGLGLCCQGLWDPHWVLAWPAWPWPIPRAVPVGVLQDSLCAFPQTRAAPACVLDSECWPVLSFACAPGPSVCLSEHPRWSCPFPGAPGSSMCFLVQPSDLPVPFGAC